MVIAIADISDSFGHVPHYADLDMFFFHWSIAPVKNGGRIPPWFDYSLF
jgi:hypothetical protein